MRRMQSIPIGTTFMLLIASLAVLGIGYGLWAQALTIEGRINTGNLAAAFVRAFTDDDGTPDESSLDANDTGDCPIQAGGNTSCDPAASGPDPKPRHDKDVASCIATFSTDGLVGTVAKEGVYPGYFCTAWFQVANQGRVPVRIARATIEGREVLPGVATTFDLDGDGEDDVSIHLTGFDLCQQIDPSKDVLMDIDQEILQGAPQGARLSYTVEVTLQQWNEECVGPTLKEQVEARLAGDVFVLDLITIDPEVIARLAALPAGESTELDWFAVGSGARIQEDLLISANRISLRPNLEIAIQKVSRAGSTADLAEFEEVALPPEQNFHLGGVACTPSTQESPPACGSLTIINAEQAMVSGLIWEAKLGLGFFEPVDMVLGTPGANPGLHVVYHTTDTVNPFTEDEQPPLPDGFVTDPVALADGDDFAANIVLDGDQTFYSRDPSTVWQRMDAVFNNVWFIYAIIEPLSLDWSLDLDIKGMEVWINGGPTATDKIALTNALTDPSYFLIHPVSDQELHFFFVGYNVTGVYGRAGGIGDPAKSAFGGDPGDNHAYGEARSTQSLKTKWVVMAHEIGHLVGGIHSLGQTTGCAGGYLAALCGPSLMPAGGAGAPDTRQPYFSDANDTQITNVLSNVLGP